MCKRVVILVEFTCGLILFFSIEAMLLLASYASYAEEIDRYERCTQNRYNGICVIIGSNVEQDDTKWVVDCTYYGDFSGFNATYTKTLTKTHDTKENAIKYSNKKCKVSGIESKCIFYENTQIIRFGKDSPCLNTGLSFFCLLLAASWIVIFPIVLRKTIKESVRLCFKEEEEEGVLINP